MIPIFRAKKLDSDEYVEGFLTRSRCNSGVYILPSNYNQNENIEGYEDEISEIDTTTLSIHFPDMLDSQGNKIFASLNENRKGGDILIEEGRYEDGFNPIFEPYFRKSSLSIFDLPKTAYGEYQLKYYKIIGIQQ